MSMRSLFIPTLIAFLVWTGPTSRAQTTTATVSGAIRDETGGILPGVSVTLRNLDTGLIRSVLTDDEGRYRAPELALGNYEIQAELAGFKTAVRSGIKLTLGREANVDIVLKVGEISEKVVVSGEAAIVETSSAALSSLVDDKKIRDLPLNGRSFTDLALLQEGVAAPANAGGGSQPGNEGQKVSVSGTRVTQTAFLLDGSDMRNAWGTTPGSVAGVMLGVDTIREFTVVTSAASAEYGGFTGGVVNAVTRSGTNTLHGSAFEFLRNSTLDARNFFDPGTAPPPFKRNQFGFTVGGPIAKDKTFFFGSYEALRDRLTTTSIITVPDTNARNGVLPPSRGGNVVVDPAVKPYLALYPLPNGRNFGDGTGEYIYSNPIPTDENYFMIKVDHSFSPRDSIFVRYTFDDGTKNNFSSLPAWVENRVNRNQYTTIDEKRIFSPSLINQFRFTLNRTRANGNIETDVDPGLKFVPLADRVHGTIAAAPLVSWGPSPLPTLAQVVNLYDYADSIVYSLGRHTLKAGFNFTRLQYNVVNPNRAQGAYTFSDLQSLLQGRAQSFRSVVNPLINRGMRENLVGMFLQDDFRARTGLTLNLGLRYDFITNPSEVAGRLSMLDNPADTVFRVGNPVMSGNPSLKSFGPRVGVAWDPSGQGKMSIRSGFGIYYDFIMPPFLLTAVTTNPPFSIQVTPANPVFPNVYSTLGPLINQCASTVAAKDCPIVLGIFGINSPHQSYVMQYNLTLQREIARMTVVTAGYQGSRGVHLNRMVDANIAIPQYVDGRVFFPANSTRRNPLFDQQRFDYWDANSFYNAFRFGITRRFDRGFQFQSSYTFGRTVDDSSSTNPGTGADSPNGIMNSPDNSKFDRGLSSFDFRHVSVFNVTYELPFGAGRAWGGSWTGLQNKLLGGWQISGIFRASTGTPENIRLSFERSRSRASLDLGERPDLRPGATNNPVLAGGRDPSRYYDSGAFVLQPAGFFGNLGRNTVIGPGAAVLDLSLVKETSLWREGTVLQFRAEFFNMLNRANFGRPNVQVFTNATGTPSSSAGRITTTTTTARQVQFALKLLF